MDKRILVIDNDEDILGIISYILKDKGYNVTSSTTENILSDLDTLKPDLIILDNWLDKTSGSVLCKQLKSNKSYQHIPIMMISAINGLKKAAKECKADDYIEKPFDVTELENRVAQLLT
jgi:DNA-binding response OmpR family regulator